MLRVLGVGATETEAEAGVDDAEAGTEPEGSGAEEEGEGGVTSGAGEEGEREIKLLDLKVTCEIRTKAKRRKKATSVLIN